MSLMIPQATVDVMRKFVNVSVELYGIDCTLYVANNLDSIERKDAYIKPSDFAFMEYSTKVFIDWKPDKYRLRKLGLFLEGDLPLVCWFSYTFTTEGQDIFDLDITRGSYFKIGMQYIPGNAVDTDEFEIVDVMIPGAHDKVITKFYKIAPRRVK